MSMINDSDIIYEINQWLMEFYMNAFTFFEEVIDFFTMIWEYIRRNTRNLGEEIINIIVGIPSWLIGLGIEFYLLCNRINKGFCLHQVVSPVFFHQDRIELMEGKR